MALEEAFNLFLLAALGAIFGSFLALLAERYEAGWRSWVLARSRCTACGHALAAVDLIPIFSFVLQAGRCRYCGERIGSLPIVSEIIASGILVAVFYVWSGLDYAIVAAAGLILLLLAMIDLLHGRLPFIVTAMFALLGMLSTAVDVTVQEPASVPWDLAGIFSYQGLIAVAAWSMLTLLNHTYRRIRGIDGLGGGDAALIAASAFWLAPQDMALALSLAGVVGIAILFLRRKKAAIQDPLRFGPALALSISAVFAAGELFK